MAGHSRWTQVKHRKAGADAKRSVEFSKLVRLIAAAAREGGLDPETNPKLRQAIDQARSVGLPKDNIERAIARASGTSGGGAEATREYEAYGPGGSAIVIQAATDNPNRTTNEIKTILGEFGGKLADVGSVAWLFERQVAVEFGVSSGDAGEALGLALIDAGAEDIERDGAEIRALIKPKAIESFERNLKALGIQVPPTRIVMVPKRSGAVQRTPSPALKALLIALANHPDVVAVWSDELE